MCASINLAILSRRHENVHAIDLVLSEGDGLGVPPLLLVRVEYNALLAVDYVLRVLAAQHAFGCLWSGPR